MVDFESGPPAASLQVSNGSSPRLTVTATTQQFVVCPPSSDGPSTTASAVRVRLTRVTTLTVCTRRPPFSRSQSSRSRPASELHHKIRRRPEPPSIKSAKS
ncbi:uncharacterized protein G2W53_034213 [Senna tora]|uniref:Uncharacterized protein n=1 Tax=Senna tora TaxID=362788 RepID=A0A834T1I2_9FABA|nr:uncharacterized protein G2W53_034213 [Senna tora]